MQKPLSPLALRLLSSFVLIPLVVGIILSEGWYFSALAALCIIIAMAEWLHIARHIALKNSLRALLIGGGFVYLAFSLWEIVRLHHYTAGAYWTILFMVTVWASDSGAYLFGKTIGGPKMTPTISPNKTWSGYAGALLFPVLILILAIHVFTPNILIEQTPSFWITSIFGFAIGIVGQAGDLMISYMKRKAGLKDTGALIPGHGGILDRIDALLLALPVFMAYIAYVMPPIILVE